MAVGTANFMNPRATLEVLSGIEAFLAEQGTARLVDLIGKVDAG